MSIREQILQEIEKIKNEHPYKVAGDYETYSQYNEAWQDCAYRIESVVEAMIPENDGWIPVYQEMDDKDLPSNGEDVLISLNDNDFPITARYEKDEYGRKFRLEECYFSQCAFGNPINAWQPLPAPYKPKEEKK